MRRDVLANNIARCRTACPASAVGILLLLLTAGPAIAQGNAVSRASGSPAEDRSRSASLQRSEESAWRVGAYTGFQYQGDTDLDAGGEVEYWMVSGGADFSRNLGERFGVSLYGDYRAIGYDFDDITSGGSNVDPWETVHVFRLMPLLSFELTDQWLLVGGPVGEFSGEEEADFADSLRGGGVFGFGYTTRDKGLFLALGVIALTEIEKDTRIQPFVLADWKINDSFAFEIRADTSRGGEVRLTYSFLEKFSFGATIGYRQELFRLNDDDRNIPGPPPSVRGDGVGEETATVATLRLAYQINDRILLEGYGGTTIDGELRLENEDGNKIITSDYDDAGYGGLNLRFAF